MTKVAIRRLKMSRRIMQGSTRLSVVLAADIDRFLAEFKGNDRRIAESYVAAALGTMLAGLASARPRNARRRRFERLVTITRDAGIDSLAMAA